LNQYNADTGNQLAAIQALGNFANTGLAGNVSGQNAIAGLGQQGYANVLNGLNSLGTLNTAQNADAMTKTQVGAQKMDYNQSLIDAANQAPWARVGNLAQIAGGIGSLGGTSQTHSVGETQQEPGLGGILLGGLGGLLNLGKSFSGMFGVK
jgi:hypothetical protein